MPGEGLLLMCFSLLGAAFAALFAMAATLSGYARRSAIAAVILVILGILIYAGTMPWNFEHNWSNNIRGFAIVVGLAGPGATIGTLCGVVIGRLKTQV